MKEVMKYIKTLKKEIYRGIRLDNAINEDNYENVGKLKLCEKIEKFILKNNGKKGKE